MALNAEVSSLTDHERRVLQAIYDHFRAHGSWPTFISVDRPLRREHGLDTAAVVQALPRSLIVRPEYGSVRPAPNDDLRLTLRGIDACRGGPEDTERFVKLLRWLAEQEMAYEPEPGSEEEMPRVTSSAVAAHLGLAADDELTLRRLLAMLWLDNWGLGASGSGSDGWFVALGPDIWRFRNVQTVEDCVRTRLEWIAQAGVKIPRVHQPAPTWHYHVRVSSKSKPSWDEVRLDLSEDQLDSDFLTPYREGRPIVVNGTTVPIDDLARLKISRSESTSIALRSNPLFQAEMQSKRTFASSNEWLVARLCEDVTDQFVTQPPGSTSVTPERQSERETLMQNSYIDERIRESIGTRATASQFDVTKLLSLIEELNDNYGRRNTYASHAMLRAILDHVPPIFGYSDFKALVSNYSWARTDRKYMMKLLDFKNQADDALHRQISAHVDLLDFDDLPASICVDRLLQVSVSHL